MIWFGFVDYTGLLCGVGFGGLLLRRLLCLFALFVGVCFLGLFCELGLRWFVYVVWFDCSLLGC